MSPNALAKSQVLVEVDDALTTPDESAVLDESKRELLNAVMRMQMSREGLSGLVEFKALVDRLNREAEEASK